MTAPNRPRPTAPDLSNARWRKSRHSDTDQGCVETAFLPDGHVAVRDSKDRTGPTLVYTPREWRAFIAGAKNGEFDLP